MFNWGPEGSPQKSEWGCSTWGGSSGGCGHGRLWLLSIDVLKHGAKEWEVVMAIKSAI